MSNVKFTLIGVEQYFNNKNESVFDNLTVPTGIIKQTLTDNILLRGAEFEVQYSDPDFLKSAIGVWSNKMQPTMKRWADALAIKYNPLENYDRMEDWTDDTEGSGASSTSSTSNRASNRVESSASSHDINSDQTDTTDRDKFSNPPKHTTKRSAYDSNSYEPVSEETDSGKWELTSETETNDSMSSATQGTESDNITVSDDNTSVLANNSVHSGRIHGNIGVTTSQQMLLQELELGYWNIYEKITELFLQEFTIPVYI